MNPLLEAKIEKSKAVLKLASEMSEHYYHKPIIICYSGGKDSDVLLHLALDTLKPSEFEVLHSITTVDSPITNRYVNDTFKSLTEQGVKCSKTIPKTNMWDLIVEKKYPPTRTVRYCCAELKEAHTPNRVAVIGVREDESTKRKGRDVFGVRGGHTAKLHFFHLNILPRYTTKHLKKSKSLMGQYGIVP